MRLLLRILLGIVALVLVLVVGLVASVVIAGFGSAGRVAAVANTRIPAGNDGAGVPVAAYVARPSTPGPHPAVIMIHEFWGLNADIRTKADILAEQGYVVVAPNLFRDSTTDWIPRAIWQVISTPASQVNGDLQTVYSWLTAQQDVAGNRVGVTGFCFGGRAALQYGLTNPNLAAVVVFYGDPITDPAQLSRLGGHVLGIFGGADSSIPLSNVRAFEAGLREAGIPGEVTVYDGQPHSFVTTQSIRDGGPGAQAWNQMVGFFDTFLRGTPPPQRPRQTGAAPESTSVRYLAALAYEHLTVRHAH